MMDPRALGLPKGYTPPMDAASRAKAMRMGYGGMFGAPAGGPSFMSDAEKKKLQDKRKRERQRQCRRSGH